MCQPVGAGVLKLVERSAKRSAMKPRSGSGIVCWARNCTNRSQNSDPPRPHQCSYFCPFSHAWPKHHSSKKPHAVWRQFILRKEKEFMLAQKTAENSFEKLSIHTSNVHAPLTLSRQKSNSGKGKEVSVITRETVAVTYLSQGVSSDRADEHTGPQIEVGVPNMGSRECEVTEDARQKRSEVVLQQESSNVLPTLEDKCSNFFELLQTADAKLCQTKSHIAMPPTLSPASSHESVSVADRVVLNTEKTELTSIESTSHRFPESEWVFKDPTCQKKMYDNGQREVEVGPGTAREQDDALLHEVNALRVILREISQACQTIALRQSHQELHPLVGERLVRILEQLTAASTTEILRRKAEPKADWRAFSTQLFNITLAGLVTALALFHTDLDDMLHVSGLWKRSEKVGSAPGAVEPSTAEAT